MPTAVFQQMIELSAQLTPAERRQLIRFLQQQPEAERATVAQAEAEVYLDDVYPLRNKNTPDKP